MTTEEIQRRLDRLRESANDSARTFRTAYTFYLVVALYVLVIVSSTDHELLFRAGDVQMPIVNVGVPVVWFFVVVPWLLVLLHFNLLIQATFLADKVSQYASAIIGQTRAPKKRTEALGLLYPVPLAHKVAEIHQPGTMRRLLNTMVLVTLAVLSPTILTYAQVKFLPYQGELFTWLHRTSVGVDIGLLWWLWPRIAEPYLAWREWFNSRRLKAWAMVGATALTGFFTIVVADFPGGSIGNLTPAPVLDSLRDSLGRKYDLFGRVLVVNEPSPEILAAHYRATCESETGCVESVIAVGSPFWCRHANPLQLNNRNFRYAHVIESTLCGVNFQDAALREADLSRANLHGADLRSAELHGAVLSEAKLHGAYLREAKFDEKKAWLDRAELHRADLRDAKLHGAVLRSAELHGADLKRAELYGADLDRAELYGADLIAVKLHGAVLSGAKLHGAVLSGAELHGANLVGAKLHGAHLVGAKLHGADLREAKLQGGDLRAAEFHGADLRSANLYGAYLLNADFYLADLRIPYIKDPPLTDEELKTSQQIINDIQISWIRDGALRRFRNLEDPILSFRPQSLKDAVICRENDLANLLDDSTMLKNVLAVDCPSEDIDKLTAYCAQLKTFVLDLVRSDETGYIGERIKERRTEKRVALPDPFHNDFITRPANWDCYKFIELS